MKAKRTIRQLTKKDCKAVFDYAMQCSDEKLRGDDPQPAQQAKAKDQAQDQAQGQSQVLDISKETLEALILYTPDIFLWWVASGKLSPESTIAAAKILRTWIQENKVDTILKYFGISAVSKLMKHDSVDVRIAALAIFSIIVTAVDNLVFEIIDDLSRGREK